jgi:hypothetical protein
MTGLEYQFPVARMLRRSAATLFSLLLGIVGLAGFCGAFWFDAHTPSGNTDASYNKAVLVGISIIIALVFSFAGLVCGLIALIRTRFSISAIAVTVLSALPIATVAIYVIGGYD